MEQPENIVENQEVEQVIEQTSETQEVKTEEVKERGQSKAKKGKAEVEIKTSVEPIRKPEVERISHESGNFTITHL